MNRTRWVRTSTRPSSRPSARDQDWQRSFGNVYKASLLGMSVAVKEIGKCVAPHRSPRRQHPSPRFPSPTIRALHARTARRPRRPRAVALKLTPRPFLPRSLAVPNPTASRPERDLYYLRRFPHPNVVQVFAVRGERQAVHGDGISPLLPPQQERGEQDEHPPRHLRRRPRARPPSPAGNSTATSRRATSSSPPVSTAKLCDFRPLALFPTRRAKRSIR